MRRPLRPETRARHDVIEDAFAQRGEPITSPDLLALVREKLGFVQQASIAGHLRDWSDDIDDPIVDCGWRLVRTSDKNAVWMRIWGLREWGLAREHPERDMVRRRAGATRSRRYKRGQLRERASAEPVVPERRPIRKVERALPTTTFGLGDTCTIVGVRLNGEGLIITLETDDGNAIDVRTLERA